LERLFEGLTMTPATFRPYYGPSYQEEQTGFSVTTDYTAIRIKAEPSKVTQDLWITSRTPLKVTFARAYNDYPFVVGLLIILLASILASMAAASLVFHDNVPRLRWFALLGVANLATLMGFVIAAILFNIHTRFLAVPLAETKYVKFIFTFSGGFVALMIVLGWGLPLLLT
ncbi:MAG: hypothetical protein AABY13_00325, partial [Nanoarchaeota archaeon]